MKRTIKVAGVVPANDIFYYQSQAVRNFAFKGTF